MTERASGASQSPGPPLIDPGGRRFDVRSITGACYTIVEEVAADGTRTYHTAYAQLPVVANDDGSFTIVETGTRLVRSDTWHP